MPTASINGFRMYYETVGQGIPLLFVHGGLGGGRGSATFREQQMTTLAQHATVIAFDRRAAGVSETPASGYTFDGFIADIIALMDYLGYAKVVLMGHSAGGPQALQCTLSQPHRVLALVLGSTATQTVNVPPELAALITSLGTTGLTQLQNMLAVPSGGGAVDPFTGVLQTYLAYHLHGNPIAPRLSEIQVPTLILHGTADEEVPFSEAERLQAGIATTTFLPFVGGGHGIMTSHALPYSAAITAFLQSLSWTGD